MVKRVSLSKSKKVARKIKRVGYTQIRKRLPKTSVKLNSIPRLDSAPTDPGKEWFKQHYEEAAGQTLSFLNDAGISVKGKDVIDVGSGDGVIDLGITKQGKPKRLVGYDVVPTKTDHLLEKAKQFGVASKLPMQLEFKTSEPTRIPARDNSFDIAVTWSVFEHVADPVSVLKEIRRVLRPEGALFLQLWPFHRSDRGSHLWEWFPEPFHHLLHHEDEIVSHMKSSDIHDSDFTQYMIDEFRNLNRLTVEELHRSLLAADFRVAKLEFITNPVTIPVQLSQYPLEDLGISGIKLIAL